MISEETDNRVYILIVEDELIIAQNLKRQLEKLGYQVSAIVTDETETRSALEKKVPDAVLMDISLNSGDDGVELAKWIDQTYHIPVIFLTSHTDTATFERARKSMPYGYLTKPVHSNQLGITIALTIQRRSYEQQLIAERNRADEMNRLKSNFLANMNHEVRTPLNSIIGFANLLRDEITGKQPHEFLDHIEEGGYQLLQTIDDILEISEIESSSENTGKRKMELESELDKVLGYYIATARDKNIRIDKIVNTSGVIVNAEPRLLGQLIRKLVDNAIKFTDKGSVTITIDTAERDQESIAVLRVSDTGIGIDTSFKPHLFEEFQQESKGLARKYEGVGLGLTIVKKILDIMGGFIEVDSKKGEGSVFTVCIPLDD